MPYGATPRGVSAPEILRALATPVPPRTLQYRLKHLVTRNRLIMDGDGRWARYRMPDTTAREEAEEPVIPLSEAGSAIRDYVRQAPEARKPVGYDRKFLDRYRPNVSFYLTEQDRTHLAAVGSPAIAEQPAGAYAKQILSRLLIDLSWNSSRLEGNTYSFLDTKRLIELGEEAVGGAPLEAQMILNHKDAIEFLVGAADEIGFNRYTLLNLHALLANNLLADPAASGRLRFIAVGLERSAFHPLEVPQLIEQSFDQILATAAAISDPFEQAFFVMVQLPYLQPFDAVNKRVSRLAANIPLIKRNLTPLSFADVPRQTCKEAVLGVCELNRLDLPRDVFIWVYARSAARYAAVRQSLGEPDPFQLRYREQLRALMAELVRGRVGRRDAATRIAAWSKREIHPGDRERFAEIAEAELIGLHEGSFARYRIHPSEFAATYVLTIERFFGLTSPRWKPSRDVNVILGGGDVDKTTILEAVARRLSPVHPTPLAAPDDHDRQSEARFSIEAVLSVPAGARSSSPMKPSWPWEWGGVREKKKRSHSCTMLDGVLAGDETRKVVTAGALTRLTAWAISTGHERTGYHQNCVDGAHGHKRCRGSLCPHGQQPCHRRVPSVCCCVGWGCVTAPAYLRPAVTGSSLAGSCCVSSSERRGSRRRMRASGL